MFYSVVANQRQSQQKYARYGPRTASTAVAAAVLSFYEATLWAIACARFSFSVNKRTLERPFRSKMRKRCAHTSSHFPLQPFTSLSKIMKGACALSLSRLSKVSPKKRACTCSRPCSLLYALCLSTQTSQGELGAFSNQDFPA